ncbi:conserved virulence factor C family protein [Caldibacillus thermolactis]|uniref:Conserved virulence factor C family protein n=1 Tax=Pallidibacillus thermolactis TaxID=251051 RepID=A0ABT2WD72_9BACI|nr:conserved virulence factor C family protein [Pallidibacillus thermolactis]MCU9593632.1 conserved virulence factor C family protein [Pallidibacillus thermolactis]
MKIKAIEPTPSPNTMKVILDEKLPSGTRNNYRKENLDDAPEQIKKILSIEGVTGVYHVADFMAVERHGKTEWEKILPEVRHALGEEQHMQSEEKMKPDEHYGEVQVQIQVFKGIPLQVKLMDGTNEKRFGLPKNYVEAFNEAQLPGDNFVVQRKWMDWGIRYGDMDEIGQTVLEEVQAAYPQSRLDELVEQAKNPNIKKDAKHFRKVILDDLDHPDWRKRFQILEQMEEPTLADLPVLEKALNDEKPSIRRLAVVYLGMIEDKRVLPYIYKGLQDKNVTVRRTAGDCLSDLGFPEAQDEMIRALKDKSKIVRWRAAMFLYEVGDEKALPALREAENDSEFEVALQIKMAIERIEGGEEAKGSVWKQMTEARKKND